MLAFLTNGQYPNIMYSNDIKKCGGNMKKKTMAVLLVVTILLVGFSPVRVSAAIPSAEDYNRSVTEYANNIFSKYHIYVSYPIRSDGYAALGTATLATLEQALSYLSPDFTRKLSKYYYETYGKRLTIEYTYLPDDLLKRDIAALGFFSAEDANIQLFLPTNNANMVVTGCSPFTVLHEIGHAYFVFLSNKIGIDKLTERWQGYNSGIKYSTAYRTNPDKETFVSYYASVNVYEDFADTFAYAFGSNRDGLGISHRFHDKKEQVTGLGKKIRFIESSLVQYMELSLADTSLAQLRSAQATISYQGKTLSGNSLEYTGYNSPYGILDNILEYLKIDSQRNVWVWEIGGWKVYDKLGGVYIVFPGCRYVTLKIPTGRPR